MIDICVKQIEGLGENLSFAGCYITVENNLIDVITPLTQNSLESSVKIPSTGKLHLIIKNMREGDKMIGSVSFQISLLTASTHWLPLFDSLEYDYLHAIPEKVDCPRIQIALTYAEADQPSSFVDKIKSLHLKIMDLEHTLASERWEFQREIGSLSSSQRYREDSQALVIEQLKLQVEKQEVLIQDLLSQKNDAKSSIEKENGWKAVLEERLRNLYVEFEKTLTRSQERDVKYLNTIDVITKENLENKAKIQVVSGEMCQKDLLICHLKEKISHLALENYENMIGKLQEKAGTYQEHLKASEQSRNMLQSKIEGLIDRVSSFNQCMSCMSNEKEIEDLSAQLESLRIELRESENKENKTSFHTQDSEVFKDPPASSDLSSKILQLMLENKYLKSQMSKIKRDEIDEALEGCPEVFTRISTGLYTINGMKVNLFVDNNVLMCRMGTAMKISDFLNNLAHGSNSTTPCENSFKEMKFVGEIASEVGECSFTSEEDKKEELKKRMVKAREPVLKKQYKPDKKAFAPLRQTSAHLERKRASK